jgi:hypothetical protein
MIWEGKRLNDVTEADLRQVLAAGTEEHKHLDYKAELYGGNDAGQKDFLVDVCAFANAEGGILLLGVPELRDAETGKPTGVPDLGNFHGIETPNPESVLIAYDAKVVSCIEERISLETRSIRLANGRHVLAIRVPNSLNKPHCVRRDEKRYFPSRRDRHIYYMDVQEIKDLAIRTASRREQAERLLQDALAESSPEENAFPYLAFASIPVFSKDFLVDLRDQNVVEAMRRFELTNGAYGNVSFTFKGIERRGQRQAVAQLHRNGLVRFSQQVPHNVLPNGAANFFPVAIDLLLRKFVAKASAVYQAAGVTGPFVLSLALRTRGQAVASYPDFAGLPDPRGSLEPGKYAFPTVEAYDFADFDAIMRPLCDQVHQGFGEAASPKFDVDGKWIER